ncbi:MAG: hypothetical protein Q8M19_15850 [Reyranella sp.]|uniref:hypothetical protein n=1 Tax=Reyranella sp. TaxID=1929291 RepID=UPI0012141D8E|nr:hypothetical protein [Reyranella sp.]MDP2332160.1 hypothetical protein [Reyranella sp.]TAJ41400.1 MAG: hypothetical protein EPO55_05555 [Reyranella sp.]
MRSRFDFKPGGKPRILPENHRAVVNGEPLFTSRVFSARDLARILIPGEMNSKIGGLWEKGWRGTRIVTLSLPERSTCPRSCEQWRSCYGNRQRFTIRVRPDEHLIPKLEAEIGILLSRFSRISVRLHQLGDFFDEGYARFWVDQVRRRPGLHCFGFTAWPKSTPIGKIIDDASREWDRFKVRFSGAEGERSTEVMEAAPRGRHADGAITCPAETGDTPKCESCGLCLTTTKKIIFALH